MVPAKWRNPIGIAGAVIVAFVILTALVGNLIWTNAPNTSDADRLLGPSWAHPFGTDEIGRDTLARIKPARTAKAKPATDPAKLADAALADCPY